MSIAAAQIKVESTNFPPDISSCHHILHEQEGVIQSQQETILKLEREVNFLEEKFRLIQRQLFGRSSERRVPEPPAGQLEISLSGEVAPEQGAISTQDIAAHQRRKSKTPDTEPGVRFPEDLCREEVLVPVEVPPDAVKISEKITERLACNRQQFYVKRYIRPVYKSATEGMVTPAAVPAVIDRAPVEPSFLAYIVVAKFLWHLPLYRQERMLEAQGIRFSRQTLVNYVIRLAGLLSPIVKCLMGSILESKKLSVDETPIQVGKNADGDKHYKQAYLWPVLGEKNEIAFFYAPGRGKEHLVKILGNYTGYLHADGYEVYQSFCASTGATLVACWAHARRKFVKAELTFPKEANKALEFIRALYQVEANIKENSTEHSLGAQEIQAIRQEEAVPIIRDFKNYLLAVMAEPTTLPKSSLCEACSYALNRWDALGTYTTNGILDIDNNKIEQQIRPVTLGRKNWLFCASEVGAHAVATFYSLINSCKLQKIDPFLYLSDIIEKINSHPASKIRELLPRNWKPPPA